MENIYLQLLNEGTKVYRPVPALKKENNVFEIQGYDIYNSEDEEWEFEPGSSVIVEQQLHSKKFILVAISLCTKEKAE